MAELPDIGRFDDWNIHDLLEAKDVLTAVKGELAVTGELSVMIGRFPRGTSDLRWRPEYHDRQALIRMRIVDALVNQKILTQARDVPGQGIEVAADLVVVKEVLGRIEEHLAPPSRPQPSPALLPRPARQPSIFWQRFSGTMGDLSAWGAMIVGFSVILGLACWVFPGLGRLLISVLETISSRGG